MKYTYTRPSRFTALAAFAVVVFLLSPAAAQQSPAKPHSMHSDHPGREGMVMPMDDQTQMHASYQSALLADKEGSEFNHHLAGILIILAGVFILVEGMLSQDWSFLHFAWPICFLLSGLFLAFYTDSELWPFGPPELVVWSHPRFRSFAA
jgi:hypothetical protein